MNSAPNLKPLTKQAWVWKRSKWPFLGLVVLPGVIYLIQSIFFANGSEKDANVFFLLASLAAIPTLWFVSPIVISYIHGLVQATDKTTGSVFGLTLMATTALMLFFKDSIPVSVGALFPGVLLLGILGFFGMLRVAGPRASTLKGVELLRSNSGNALKYLEAAAFTADFRPNLLGLSVQMLQAGQSHQALKLAEHLTEVAPGEANNWCGRSYVAYQSGHQDESFTYLERALEIEPNNAEIYYNRGVRRSNDEKTFELSLKDYSKAIAIDDTQARYFANRAALYNRMKRHESALADAKKAHALDDNDQVARTQAFLALTGLGREDELESWMQAGSLGLGGFIADSSQSEFSGAVSEHLQGDSDALKANYSGESLLVISPEGIKKIEVDEL